MFNRPQIILKPTAMSDKNGQPISIKVIPPRKASGALSWRIGGAR